jgi:hypothetical protein
MATLSALILAAIVNVAQAQSLNVVNSCSESVFLYTSTSFGTIDSNVNVAAGQSANLGISSNWDGAINVGKYISPLLSFSLTALLGTGCNSDGSTCTTGGPTWDGSTPFSRAEFNFVGPSRWN